MTTAIESSTLPERIFASGCTRLGVVSLHPGAGARTVVERLAEELHQRQVATGVTRAPRIPVGAEDAADYLSRITLPEGSVVASAIPLADASDNLQRLGSLSHSTSLGELALYRVHKSGEVPVYGPDDPASVAAVLAELERQINGLILVDGAWERRGFAAPGVTQAVVLAVGAGYSSNPEQAAAAARHIVELFQLPRCDGPAGRAWRDAVDRDEILALDGHGHEVGTISRHTPDPAARLDELGREMTTLVLPGGLSDVLISSLTRSTHRTKIVVKDPTRIDAAPVYYQAWLKKGGQVEVVDPVEVLAVASNGTNVEGPDVDPAKFRALVAEAIPDVPVHDVTLEQTGRGRKSRWKFWSKESTD